MHVNSLSHGFFTVIFLSAALALGGCATSNQLVSQWSNPGYVSPSFKRIMVGGSGGEKAIRRNFEDEFVLQLKAAGIDAVPSYRYLPEEDNLDEAKLKKAAKEAGADAVILARSVGVEQRTEYRDDYYSYPHPAAAFGFFGHRFGASWFLPGPRSVRHYDVYTSEATLYDVAKNEVVWSGTLKTVQPDNFSAAIKDYVEKVVKALKEKKLL